MRTTRWWARNRRRKRLRDLNAFVTAQDAVWAQVMDELRAGRKASHWMWFVFPQVAGLGHSATAIRFAIPSLSVAEAYLKHEILGRRLVDCTETVLMHEEAPIEDIFGSIDAMKFRSSMTLFDAVPGTDPVFRRALDSFFDGVADARTQQILAA